MVAIRDLLGEHPDVWITGRTICVPVGFITRGQLQSSKPSVQRKVQKRLGRQIIQCVNGKTERLDK